MRVLKLMANYDCFPLWEASPGIVGNVDPATLPISSNLRNLLHAWAKAYNLTLNKDDPLQSGFSSPEDELRFKEDGHKLAGLLQAELGSEVSIITKV